MYCWALQCPDDDKASDEVRHWAETLRSTMEVLRFARRHNIGAMLRDGRAHPAFPELEALAQTSRHAGHLLLDVRTGVDRPLFVSTQPKATRRHLQPRARSRERRPRCRRGHARAHASRGPPPEDDPEPAAPAPSSAEAGPAQSLPYCERRSHTSDAEHENEQRGQRENERRGDTRRCLAPGGFTPPSNAVADSPASERVTTRAALGKIGAVSLYLDRREGVSRIAFRRGRVIRGEAYSGRPSGGPSEYRFRIQTRLGEYAGGAS
jgi:hypothetical protein